MLWALEAVPLFVTALLVPVLVVTLRVSRCRRRRRSPPTPGPPALSGRPPPGGRFAFLCDPRDLPLGPTAAIAGTREPCGGPHPVRAQVLVDRTHPDAPERLTPQQAAPAIFHAMFSQVRRAPQADLQGYTAACAPGVCSALSDVHTKACFPPLSRSRLGDRSREGNGRSCLPRDWCVPLDLAVPRPAGHHAAARRLHHRRCAVQALHRQVRRAATPAPHLHARRSFAGSGAMRGPTSSRRFPRTRRPPTQAQPRSQA